MKNVNSKLILVFIFIIFIELITAHISYAKFNKTDIVGMWLFDEGKGNTVSDLSGNENNGTIIGTPIWEKGSFGNSLSINASNYVRVPHKPELSLKTFTITAWLSTKAGGAWIGVISKSFDNPTRNYTLYLHQNTNTASISIGNKAAGTWSDATGKTPVNDGKWHHVAISFDEKSKIGKVFTDGVQEAQYNVLHEVPINEADLVFAAWHHSGGNSGYIGLLDEIAIFKVALDENDIKGIMQNGLGKLNLLSVESKGKIVSFWGKVKSF